MKLKFNLLLFTTFISINVFSSDEMPEDCNNINVPESERSFSNNFTGNFNGKNLKYTASLKEKILYEKDNPNEPMASFFIQNISLILMITGQ